MTTRDLLIETAADLFLGKGYGAVGTAEICKTAGVNRGTFYHFFPSKTDLLVNVIERYAEQFRRAFVDISASDIDPRDKLRSLFDVPGKANAAWKKEHGYSQGCLVGNMTLELSSIEEPVRLAVERALSNWSNAVEPIISSLIQKGDLPAIEIRRGADLVIAMIQGGLVLAKANNDPARITSMAEGAFGALVALAPKH